MATTSCCCTSSWRRKVCPPSTPEVAESARHAVDCCRRLQALGYSKVALKAQIGGSGIGMLCLPAAGADAANIPEYLFHEGPCLVQGWLEDEIGGVELIGSPSVQLFLTDHEVSLYDVTEQILGAHSVHEGNIAPPPYAAEHPAAVDRLLAVASRAALWLHSQGYRGTASVDFVLLRRAGELQAIAAEINARVTGASYPSILARHFVPGGAWLMRNLRFHRPLPARDVLAAPGTGALPVPPRRRGRACCRSTSTSTATGRSPRASCCAWRRTPPPCSARAGWWSARST